MPISPTPPPEITVDVTDIPELIYAGTVNPSVPAEVTAFVKAYEGNSYHVVHSTVGEMNGLGDAQNTLAIWMETTATEVYDNALESATSATEAAASANNKGNWSALTGALNIPASVNHNGSTWILNVDLVDVTASEPTDVNTDWTKNGVSSADLALKLDKNNPTTTGTLTAPTIDTPTIKRSSYVQIADATVSTTTTHTFDFALGDGQKLTIGGDTVTIAFANFITGEICTFNILAENWGAWTPVFPTGLVGAGKTFPTFTAVGIDEIMIKKDKNDVFSLYVVGLDVGVMV